MNRFVIALSLCGLATSLSADIVTSGLIQDLDADVGVTTSGANVTAWANQAPSGGDHVAANNGSPQLVAGPNGHNAVSLNGGARLAGSDPAAFDGIMQGSGHTWFVVIKPDTQGGGGSPAKNAVFGTLLNGSPWSGVVAHVNGTTGALLGNYMLRPGGSDFFITGTTDLNDGNWHIVVGRLASGTGNVLAELFTDGPAVEASSTSAPISASSNSDLLAIGAERTGGGEHYDGDIARILIYNRPLNDTEINQTGGALAQAYDIPDHGFITGPLPVINRFTASANGIASGTPVTLSWDVTDPEGGTLLLAISPGVGDVTGTNSVVVTPAVTTTYTLIAENINGSESATVTVAVDEPPVINFFTADDVTIRVGESTTLRWDVGAANRINIDGGVGDVTGLTAIPVSPATTTTYTLTATNGVGAASASVTVNVDLRPVILSFASDRTGIDPGETITLSWEITGADQIAINQGIGDVTGLASIQDAPLVTTTYSLSASNVHGVSMATATVVVGETVTLSEFLASNNGGLLDEDLESSDWIELWNTTGQPIDVTGWYLTDDPFWLTKWQLPTLVIPANGYQLVFASGKDRRVPGQELHTNFELNADGEYLALVKSDGTTIVRAYAPPFPEQQTDISYGLFGPALMAGYFDPPTPGAANGTGFAGFVADTRFTYRRGFYDVPINVEIATDTTGAQIRYTLDGSEPTATTGTVYTGPIPINSTTVLRAAAFKAGLKESNVDTQSYLYTSDIRNQSEMDSDVVNAAPYNASIEEDLKAIPAVSLVLPDSSLFGGSGIYSNPGGRGMAWERAVSIEFFTADGSEEFQENAGLRIHGADARNHQKKPFKVYFRSIYGAGRLNYPLFSGPVREFDKLVLRGAGHEAWTSPYGSGTGAQAWSATYMRDEWLRQTHDAMGNLSPRGRNVHLFLNGDYWGVYNIHERPDEEYGASHLGGAEEDYDIIKTGGAVVDGNKTAWNSMMNLANSGLTGSAAYQQMLDHIDEHSLIDNMIVRIWAGDIDWLRSALTLGETGNRNKNWYALRKSRNGTTGWQFFVWDGELSMGKGHRSNRNLGFNLTDVDINDSPGRLYAALKANAEFRLLFADRLQRHFFSDGAMTPENNRARWNALADEVRGAVVAESARWGDAIRSNPYTRDVEWNDEVTWMAGTYMEQRNDILLQQFAGIGLFPATQAPFLNQHGGSVPVGFSMTLNHPNPSGTIFYTDDGSDPRQAGGAVAATAQAYAGPVVLNAQTRIRARVQDGASWSPEIDVIFFTPQDYSGLHVTEIMYNPPAFGLFDGSAVEFLELKNTGPTALSLGGLVFTVGLTYSFPTDAVLAPGEFFVLVRDPVAFGTKYPGVGFDGTYVGALNNGGETLRLSHFLGFTVFSVTYGEDVPWPVAPDNHGFSLVPVDSLSDPNSDQARHWRASAQIGGSPGADDPVSGIPPVVINEALTHTDLPEIDAIELLNPSGSAVNVGGWFLSDSESSPRKFRIPDGTMIPAGGYLLFEESDFNPTPGVGGSFSLSSRGDSVFLLSGDAATNLTGYSHGFAFGAAANGVSFGLHAISTGEERFPAQLSATLGAANSGPRVGPVVITEIHYNPLLGGVEFVEIENISGTTVSLFDPANSINTWRVNGLGYAFPGGITLAPGERLLLVPVDPATFRSMHGLPPSLQIQGPYPGTLQNSGENLELQRPDTPDPNGVPYIVVDAVRYNDKAPWAMAADGGGPSLQRRVPGDYGDDPVNWDAALPTPGNVFPGGTPPAITTPPADATVVAFQAVMFVVEATGPGPLSYQWMFNGNPLPGETGAALSIPSVLPQQEGEYRVAVYNAGGSVVSAPATLTVLIPANITLQPQPVTVREGTNVNFTVMATSSTPITYQWLKNGKPIPGAVTATLTILNVTGSDDALYSVVVTDGVGPVESQAARLTVLINPAPVDPVAVLNVVEGGHAVFSLQTVGTLPMSYRWRKGFITLTNYTDDSNKGFFHIPNVQPSDAGAYSVILTNQAFFTPGVLVPFTLNVLPDTDGDGMSDAYETQHGLDMNSGADALLDPDNDMKTNLEESIAGTDPNDGNRFIRLDGATLNHGVCVEFTVPSNLTYTLEFSDTLIAPSWQRLEDIVARQTSETIAIKDEPGQANRFYRLVTPRRP